MKPLSLQSIKKLKILDLIIFKIQLITEKRKKSQQNYKQEFKSNVTFFLNVKRTENKMFPLMSLQK